MITSPPCVVYHACVRLIGKQSCMFYKITIGRMADCGAEKSAFVFSGTQSWARLDLHTTCHVGFWQSTFVERMELAKQAWCVLLVFFVQPLNVSERMWDGWLVPVLVMCVFIQESKAKHVDLSVICIGNTYLDELYEKCSIVGRGREPFHL